MNIHPVPPVPNVQNRIASLCHIGIMRSENQNRLRMDERKQNIQNDCRISGIERTQIGNAQPFEPHCISKLKMQMAARLLQQS